jgi:hypothetical protein
MLSGPRRAQAREQVASRIGSMPEILVGASRLMKAHAVTSRVTSWAIWFLWTAADALCLFAHSVCTFLNLDTK